VIDWPAIKDLAKTVIADLSGAKVVWQDEAEGSAWDTTPIIYLRISALGDVGIPAESVDEDETVTVSSQKRFTLSLRGESFDQDLASGKHAGALLETVKTRLGRSSTIERLRGVFCVQETLGTSWFNYASQGRQVSCYVLDLACATVDNDVDELTSGDFIEEVLITSDKVRDIGGQETNTQVDLDVTGGA